MKCGLTYFYSLKASTYKQQGAKSAAEQLMIQNVSLTVFSKQIIEMWCHANIIFVDSLSVFIEKCSYSTISVPK